MSDAGHTGRRESPWRFVRECVFGLCTLWLVVQNTLLLVALLRWEPNALSLAFDSLHKAFLLMSPLWVIPAAAVVGLTLTTTLTRDAAGDGAKRWETNDGRTR